MFHLLQIKSGNSMFLFFVPFFRFFSFVSTAEPSLNTQNKKQHSTHNTQRTQHTTLNSGNTAHNTRHRLINPPLVRMRTPPPNTVQYNIVQFSASGLRMINYTAGILQDKPETSDLPFYHGRLGLFLFFILSFYC